MIVKLLVSTCVIFVTVAAYDQVFENSENLCNDRCSCKLSSDKRSAKIDCSDRRIHHTIDNWPEFVSKSENIVAVFKDNNITTLEEMPGTDATLKLVFSNCNIKYLNTGLFGSAINVKYLDLSHNLLENDQLGADVFKGPYNISSFRPIALEYLNLAYNLLHSLQKDIFEHTPYLKVLNLEGNRFRVLDHVTTFSFANIPNLQKLNLAHNHLTEIPINALKVFERNLTELNLAINDLDFVPSSLAYIHKSLQILNISGNPIIEFNNISFEGLESLLKLYANNLTELTSIRAHAFANLKNLVVLQLSNNYNLFEIDPDAFYGTENIEELHMEGNSLVHLTRDLLPWSRLRVLRMKGNRLYCDCDLYNISQQLGDDIKRDGDGPYCLDARAYTSRDVYSLKVDACGMWSYDEIQSKSVLHKSMTVMRIILSLMMVLLVLSTILAVWLAIMKWKTYKRSLNYPFPNQVVYNPVSTIDSRY